MFKRLTRTRRHSADEIGGLHHVSGKNFNGDELQPQRYRDKSDHHHHHHHRREQSASPSPATSLRYGNSSCPSPTPTSGYLHSAKSRFTRRSCGDAYSLLSCSDEDASSNSGESTCTTRSQLNEQPQQEKERDYTLVTAVPAFIVEHEPEKQKSGLKDVWGLRRMGKKLDSFRRSGSRDSICGTIPERPDTNHNHIDGGGGTTNNNNNNNYNSNNNNNVNHNNNKNNNNHCAGDKLRRSSSSEKKSKRSASPFKSFFIRMGSTGMLNTSSSKQPQSSQHQSRRSSQANCDGKSSSQTSSAGDKDGLFRSCSTSQLNTSPTYVKGDDPSEGIDLRMTSNKLSSLSPAQQQQSDCLQSKTMSCDNLSSRRRSSSIDEDSLYGNDDEATSRYRQEQQERCQSTTPSFAPCDYNVPCRSDCMRKSSSCDFKESKKTSFPYAFLRSRLSVLPEESSRNYHGGSKEDRLFKTASEEHFPALLKIEDSFADGTTTLGRRRPVKSNSSYNNEEYQQQQQHQPHQYQQHHQRSSSSGSRYRLGSGGGDYSRNSYAEDNSGNSGYFKVPSIVRQNDSQRNSVSLPYHHHQSNDSAEPMSLDLSYDCSSERPASATAIARMPTTASLINDNRRNSVAFGNHHPTGTTIGVGEQRLSSHYVSSNESGYDSDGTRGESAASEIENHHLKCGSSGGGSSAATSGGDGSSDTSSVIDAELDKPMRSSTPASDEAMMMKDDLSTNSGNSTGLDGLRWHRSSSGRMLPSINQANNGTSSNKSESCGGILASAHRMRLQQDKTRFLTDIIEPSTAAATLAATQRIRRTRLVQLHKSEPTESLGIRLAQQRLGESRLYVIVQLESDGIAHRDGRLRLGDEIVEVEGKDLRSLSNLDEVQDFLRSCEATTIHLKTAYEETVPQIYPLDGEEVKQQQQQQDDTASATINKSSTTTTRRSEYLENARNLGNGGTLDRLDRAKILAHKRPDYLALNKITSSPISGGVSVSKTTTSSATTQQSQPHQQQQQQQQQQQLVTTRHVVRFEKGAGKPSLGFSVVGGRDSPKGDMGIFVRRIFSGGQADVQKSLFQGDEILSINGKVLRGCTHQEVIEQFKGIREGIVELELARRHRHPKIPLKTAPY